MTDLHDQVALVFGASSGIGRATAQALAAAGMRVTVAARRKDALDALAAELESAGHPAHAVAVDVSDRSQVDAAVAQTLERFGGLQVAINCAGDNTQRRTMAVLEESEWQRLLSVNLTGAFHTTQAVLPHFRAHGGGLIVQVSSVSGRWPDVSGAAYQAAKHGVVGLCQATMLEEREHGVRVTALLPGLVDTPLPRRRPIPIEESVFARAMQPQDLAQTCVFLAQLPPRAYIPEIILLPPALQVVGKTSV
jgi:NAD(P)-dependent dehydrogenase (short-subunit alcohol dehydrogenase family)